MQLRGLSGPAFFREKYSKTFFLSRAIYSLVSRISVAKSSSTRIIYVFFSVRMQTRGEWKVPGREEVWKVRRDVSKEDYYKDYSLAISRRSSTTILLPILTSS